MIGPPYKSEDGRDLRCHLCRWQIPHNDQEHTEAILGGVNCKHTGHYAPQDWKPKSSGVEDQDVYGDLTFDARVDAYLKRGMKRKRAEDRASATLRVQAARDKKREIQKQTPGMNVFVKANGKFELPENFDRSQPTIAVNLKS